LEKLIAKMFGGFLLGDTVYYIFFSKTNVNGTV